MKWFARVVYGATVLFEHFIHSDIDSTIQSAEKKVNIVRQDKKVQKKR